MIDMRYKPRFLPQVHAPYEAVMQKLDDEGVTYATIEVDPNELEPMQGITISDEVGGVSVEHDKPIWISADNRILDGHHRWLKALLDGIKILAIQINTNSQDGCRILNKIQDIHEYEESQGMEEVVDQDAINYYGGDENQFLNSMEEDNMALQAESEGGGNQKTVVAYRRDPIKENSVVGNFFTLKPVEGYEAYEITFDNLLDTNGLGVSYKDGQEPVDILAKSWFPNINFEKLATENDTQAINIKNKAVAEKAMRMGYDGIKYGNSIIQGLK